MRKITVLYLVLLLVLSISAQTVTIKGKVTNQSGKGIAGASVTLKSKKITATTDANGGYSITAVSVLQKEINRPELKSVSYINGSLNVLIENAATVTFELFDVQGTLLKIKTVKQLSSGVCRFDILEDIQAAAMMLARISIEKTVSSFRLIPLTNSLQVVNSSSVVLVSVNRLAKVQAAVDSLQASAPGYKTKVVGIDTYTVTVDFTLEIEGNVQCTQSKAVALSLGVTTSGPHKVVMETNSDQGIKEGTIYRPADLGPGKNYPIFIWGQGACSLDGRGNEKVMAEIASYGYFVIADGTPGGSGARPMNLATVTPPVRAYITWAIAENRKPCSAYYLSLDTTKVAGNGFSCGGFLGQATAGDPRTTTWGVTSSGSFNDASSSSLSKVVHTPVLIIEGHKDGTGAYTNGLRDYNFIVPTKNPVFFISNRNMGHGGDLQSANGGHFTKINLAWLNWWLKNDTGATGKGVLVGPTCKYCSDNNWEVKSANIP